MTNKVLDSWALIAFLKGEPSSGTVEELLWQARDGRVRLFLSVVNWGEVYYTFYRDSGPAVAASVEEEMAELPLMLVAADTDLVVTRQAAQFKADGGLSYADCFAAALAKAKNAELVTGDREFKRVEKKVRIHWL